MKVEAFPFIHVNGTSGIELLRQNEEARHALTTALTCLNRAWPNGRDYYLSPGAIDVALREHRSRVERVEGVLRELEVIAEVLVDQELGHSLDDAIQRNIHVSES